MAEELEKCERCKYFQGLKEFQNGYGYPVDKIDCFQFGFLNLLIDSEICQKFIEKEESR